MGATADRLVVDTTSGLVRGLERGASTVFLGIPFAEPPFGGDRFGAPRPRAPWSGVRDAIVYGPTPQRKALAEVTTIPEPSIPGDDVLNLNVFTPDTGGALPVLVYIHGGGYVAGSPASSWYDGRAFNRDGVVVVTVAYRLGFEGFGWLPDAPLNRGLLDQMLALAWVRDNIARFGGDPNRVTIAGQSAGGGAVLTLMTIPRAAGLFHRVAAMSGVPADIPLDTARATAERIAARLGVEPDRAGFASVPESALLGAQGSAFEFPQTPTSDELVLIARGLVDGRAYGPVIDGELLRTTTAAAVAAGGGGALPLLAGSTSDEFAGLATANRRAFAGIAPGDVLDRLGVDPSTARRFLAALGPADAADALGRWVTDSVFRAPLVRLVAARTGPAPTWLYDFAWDSRVSGVAEHCLDVPFVFDVLADPDVRRVAGAGAPQELADLVHGAFVRFVQGDAPGWPAYSADHGVMVFDRPAGLVREGYASARALQPASA